MTNEEAIEVIEQDIPCEYDTDLIEALNMAIEALKADPGGDAVKREAVLNTLDAMDAALDENRTVEAYKELLKECYKALPPVTPKQGWIPLTWDEPECNSSFPDDMDGSWAIFTDGKLMSIERGKKDAFDHFFPSGRWFEMSDAIAWMPLPMKYKRGESE